MAKVNKPVKPISLEDLMKQGAIDQAKENEGGGAIAKILGSEPEQGISHQSTYKPIAPSETQTMFDEGYISEEVRNSGEFTMDDLNKIAAREQGIADSFMQGVQRVVLNVVPQIVGGFASMVDIPGYFDAEHGATNSIVNAVADWEEYVNKDIAPIYRENPNKPMDFGDSAWWFENGSGLATSVISFLAQGAGAGAIVKGAGLLAKTSKVGALAKLGMSAEKVAGVSKGASALATATMLNQSESAISATQVYNSTMEHWLNEGYSAEHAKKQASTAAATTFNLNRANILLNLSSANLFLQPMSLTRQLLKPGSIGKTLGTLGFEATQEGLEEVVNTVGQKAGEAHGKGEHYGLKEGWETAQTPEAMEAALLGAVGGIVQTGGQKLMRRSSSKYSPSSTLDAEGNRISANQFEKNRYNEQQQVIQSMEENGVAIGESFTNMKKQLNLQHDVQNARTQEQYDAAQQELFTTTALNAFQSGTTEVLENLIRASQSNTEAVGDKGITEDHVKQGLAKLKILENVYNNYEGYSNLNDIFYNRANSIYATHNLEQSTNDSMRSRTELDAIAKSVAAKHPFVKTDEVLIKKDGVVDPSQTYTRNTTIPINYSITDLGNNTGDTEANRKIYDEFLAELSKTNTFHEHNANELRKDTDAEMVRKLDEDLLSLKSPKAQEEYQKKQEAQAKRDADKKIILDDKSSIADLEKIISESKDQDIKDIANEVIAEKKVKQAEVIQKKKDDVIYNKHAYNIVTATDNDTLDSIGSDIANSTEISDGLKTRLLQSIERRKHDLENGTTLSDEVVETSNNDLEDIDIADKSTNSSLPTDFNSTEVEKNIIEEVEKLAKKIIENEQSPLVNEKGGVVWQYGKTTEGHNKGAYLGRNFIQINGAGVVTREEITNELNDVNPDILNPDKLKPGHKIKLIEDFDYDGNVYDSTSNTKEEIKWSDRKKQIANDSEALQNETPIVAIDISTGKKLFYVHDINWMTAENIESTSEELYNDIQALKAVRVKVLSSGSEGIETKIDKKTSGILFKTADNKSISLSEAMPDEKLIMVVGKDGSYIGTNIENDKIIGSDNIKNGYGYAIVPVGDKFMAVPLERTTLSPEVVETVVQAVQAYLSNDEKIIQAIAGSTGDDISTLKGLSNYLRKFTYLFPIEGKSSLKNVIANSTKEFNSSNHLLSVTGNSIEFGKPSVTGSFRSISKNTPTEKIDELLSKLREHLTGSLSTIEKIALQKKENISTINENGDLTTIPYRDHIKQSHKTNVLSAKIETEKGDKYVYTYQQGITFDTTFAPIVSKPIQEKKGISGIVDIQKHITELAKDNYLFTHVTTIEDAKGITARSFEVSLGTGLSSTITQLGENGVNTQLSSLVNGEVVHRDTNNNSLALFAIPKNIVDSSDGSSISDKFENWLIENNHVTGDMLVIPSSFNAGYLSGNNFITTSENTSVQSQVSTEADSQEIESKAQTIATNIHEYSIDRLLAQIKDLEEGLTNEFQENFLTPVTDSEVADLIAIRKRAIAIRNEQAGKPVIPVKRTLSDGEIFEIKEGDVDISDNDLDEYADDLPKVSEGTENALSNALNNLQIKGLSTDHQQSLINYISATINTESIKLKEKEPKGKLDTTPIFEQKKKALEERAEMYRNSNQPNKAAKIDLIVSQFDKVKKLTNEHIKLMTTGKVSDTEVQDESIDSEEVSGGMENTTHSDDWTLTTDSKMTASVEVKQFLSFVENKENGLTKVNDLGFPEVVPFDVVYNTLHEILQGLPADYEQIENRLTAYTEFFPWIQTIIEKLDDAQDNVKNGFVSDMTKHAIKMRFVMWTQNPNGTYSLVDQDANSTSIQKQLVAHWNNNLKTADNPRSIVTVDKDGNHVFDKEKAELIVKQAEEWKENIKETTPDIESVIGWLKAFGIILNPRTIKDLQDGKFRNNGKISYTGLFNQSTGLINVLSGKLKSAIDSKATLEDVKILNDSVIKSLATMNALYESNVFSNSFNAGGKTIYSFTNNKFVVNRVRDLSTTDAEGNLVNSRLIEDLQNISFTQHSLWLNDLTSEDKALAIAFREQFGVDYLSLEALKKQFTSSKDNRKLNNLNEDEHEVIKLALFFNNSGTIYDGETRRKVSYFYPTMSDKSSMMIMNSLSNEVLLNADGSLSNKSLDKLYEALVLPEIQRIVSKQATTINGYTPNAFYFVPTLNTKTVEVGEENKTILEYIKEGRLDEVRGDVQEEVKVLFEKLLADKKADWTRLGIGKIDKDGHSFLSGDYMLNVAKGTKESKINYAASDFLFNTLIANSEAFKLVIGDPAQYSKFKNGKSIEANLEESFINIGKRLAGDIAPGVELANAENNKYYQVFLNDKKLASKAYDNKIQEALSPEVKAKYSSMEGSDAQEYTTWKEHLYVMKQLGKLTDLQFKRITDRLTQGLGLSFDDLQTVLQPMKPVYVGNQADRNENIDRRIYIKSSSFPLIPQLTKGLEIDKIRIGLENFENSNEHGATVRASFNTANKVGLIKDSVDVFDDNGNVIDGFAVTESNTLYLDRKNFRIQQEVPYNHEKEAINIGTQERKLLFNNILDMKGFKLDGVEHTGESLKEIYDQTYKEMFEYKKKLLSERLGITDSGNIPVANLRDILVAEVTSRQGYPLNILASLELNKEGTDFKIPLWASPYAEKFESLLTGVINNGIIKQKFNGHSYILGSEEGFKIKEDATEEDFSQSGIVFSDSFDAKKGLQPMRFDSNGKLLPAQIMIPFNFKNKDSKGKKLSLKDFTKIVDGKKVIDLDKLDPKILQLFGFRIPTQGHNSMSTVEIVGFLPEESGDLMLAPRDFTVQMGSDFDVDKMYTYMYNVQLQDGKLITEFENGEIENLQNKVLDIHHSVLANTNPEMVRFILAPDSFGEFEDLAAKVYGLRKKSGKVSNTVTILSDSYQRTKYINATAGKSGVGNFSLDSTFNAIIQGKDLVYYEGVEEKRPETHAELISTNTSKFIFGNVTSRGDLSNKYTLKSQALLKRGNLTKEEKLSLKLKSSVIQGLQSSAVDNEKAQILDKLNINSTTFDVIRAMAQLGFEENEIVGLLTQDIIWEYVSAMKSSNSSLVGFDPNAVETFKTAMEMKYDPNGRMLEDSFKKSDYNKDSGIELLNKLSTAQLIESENTLDSNLTQLVLLDKFLKLADVGKAIKTVQSSINTESSGLPKNLLETSSKVDQINKLGKNIIVNASTLLGNYSGGLDSQLIEPTTINGFAAYHGAIFANNIYRKYFPYTKSGFNQQYAELLEHQNASEGSQSKLIDVKVGMYKEMKSFFYTKSNLGLYDGSLLSEQKRLFIDSTDNKSLASILSTLSEKKWFKSNNFLNKLSFDVNQNGLASKVNFVASAGENYDERSIYIGFLKLLDDNASIGSFNGSEYTTRSLAQDLIAYSYLEGGQQGAKQFLKYVPVEYLKGMGFGEGLNSVEFHYEDDFGGAGGVYTTPSKFTIQYFQNNPEKAKKIDVSEIKNYDGKIDTLNNFKLINPENNFVSYFNDLGDKLSTQTQFVSIYDAKLKGKYALYQFDTQNQMYKKVQVLSGQYGFRQYNASDNILMAVQPAIEQVIPQVVELGVPTPGATQDLSDLFKTTEHTFTPDAAHISSPIEKLGDIEVDVKASGEVAIKGLLNGLIESKTINPYLKSLAEAYVNLKLPSEIKLEITEEGGRGMWSVTNNQLNLNKEELKDTDVDTIATTVLHELTHTFTSKSIKQWRKDPNSVSVEQRVAINKLEGLRKKYEAHLRKEGRENDLTNFTVSYNAWVKDKTKNADFTEKDLSELYGAVKLEEFVTMALTDVEFQHILNNIVDDNGKTMLSKLLDELMNVMNSLLKTVGIDLKENNLLRNTLVEINNLITVNQNIINTVDTQSKDSVQSIIENQNINDNFTLEDSLPSIEDIQELKRICR